ncbi:MAG: pyridoxal-phosphate dependent enzyme [Saprospiraceae bacterium]|nr:pyridoxal-phosphate dependent enzyme [Saprospiraceae bacterium]
MFSAKLSPISELSSPFLDDHQVRILIKRDDLLYGPCQGNKFRKLKYHLEEYKRLPAQQILTFGGAFSNHLYATAAAGFLLDIPTTGIIRGEIDENNPSIRQFRSWKMHLQPMDRSSYQRKDEQQFIRDIQHLYPQAYIIPEGGHHLLAQQGAGEIVDEVRAQTKDKIDLWVCAYGTGSTTLGILQKLLPFEKLHAYIVLKGFDLDRTKRTLISETGVPESNLSLIEAHLGGYGRRNKAVESFIVQFYHEYDVLLDPVYTGKLFFQLFQNISVGIIPPESTIMVIHSGGLQGIAGYNYRYGSELPEWVPNQIHREDLL